MRRRQKRQLTYLFLMLLVATVMSRTLMATDITPDGSQNGCGPGTPRNKHEWPFSCQSIWNMPIGSDAEYVPAGIGPSPWVTAEINYYIVTDESDPRVPWYVPINWGPGRCELGGDFLGEIHVPKDLIIADANSKQTPNNAAAFLAPDGRTLIQLNPLTRCEVGGPVFGYPTPQPEDIYGMGITGGQGGSGLSSIGGTIRPGELLPDAPPIPHVLKLLVYAHEYLYKQPPGYRWPAVRADAYAFNPDKATRYGGSNPNLVMGSLLAIPPNVTAKSLGLKTLPGKKLFQALQDYGGYIVDDTAIATHTIAIENGVQDEFRETYGYIFGGNSGEFYEDVNQLFQALAIVQNNSPDNIGGGGIPRRPLAPPLADSGVSNSGA
jgi:hypothetical protein